MIGRIFFAASLCAVAFIFGMFGMWVADRELPVVGINTTVVNSDVAPGQVLRIKVTGYRIRSCRTMIERYIEDSTRTRFSFADVDYLNPGPPGPIETHIELYMPHRVNPGVGIIKTNAAWECNPFHRFWPILDRQPDIAVLVSGPQQ